MFCCNRSNTPSRDDLAYNPSTAKPCAHQSVQKYKASHVNDKFLLGGLPRRTTPSLPLSASRNASSDQIEATTYKHNFSRDGLDRSESLKIRNEHLTHIHSLSHRSSRRHSQDIHQNTNITNPKYKDYVHESSSMVCSWHISPNQDEYLRFDE